jgi:predicted MFS family arabinose efflux permease
METAGPLAQLALALNASAFFGGQGLGAMGGGFVYTTFGPAALPLASMIILGLTTGMFALSRRA